MIEDALLNVFGIDTVSSLVSTVLVAGLFTYVTSVALIWIIRAWRPNVNGRMFPTTSAIIAAIFAAIMLPDYSIESTMFAIVFWALTLSVAHALRGLLKPIRSRRTNE